MSFGYLVSLSSDASVLGVLSFADDEAADDDDPICYIRAFQLHTNGNLQRRQWIQMGRDLKAGQDKDDLFGCTTMAMSGEWLDNCCGFTCLGSWLPRGTPTQRARSRLAVQPGVSFLNDTVHIKQSL